MKVHISCRREANVIDDENVWSILVNNIEL